MSFTLPQDYAKAENAQAKLLTYVPVRVTLDNVDNTLVIPQELKDVAFDSQRWERRIYPSYSFEQIAEALAIDCFNTMVRLSQ